MSRPVNRSGKAKLCVSIDRGSKNTNLFFVSAAYGVAWRIFGYARLGLNHSHSIVPGGFDVMSETTRLTPLTSLMMRVAVSPRNFMSKEEKSAVMPSVEVTARKPTTYS